MTEQVSTPTPEYYPVSEQDTNNEVAILPPPDLSQLNIDDYHGDAEFVELFTSIWLHPNTTSQNLASKISDDTAANGNLWQQRLYKTFKSWTSSDLTIEQEEDPVLIEIATFLQKSALFPNKFEHERIAARILFELSAVSLIDKGNTEAIGKVFAKMPHEVTHQ